ncbi:hypothetical protein FQR65_LT16348 [Abscondita terminalis]|nr:hypothetical protein FQR65_LT16348 [Abscondita terminalis]
MNTLKQVVLKLGERIKLKYLFEQEKTKINFLNEVSDTEEPKEKLFIIDLDAQPESFLSSTTVSVVSCSSSDLTNNVLSTTTFNVCHTVNILGDNFNLKDLLDKALIVKEFPKELPQVYFTSPIKKRQSKENKSGNARGKLVDKYRNRLTFLRQDSLLLSRSSSEVALDTETFEDDTGDYSEESNALLMQWLNECSEEEQLESGSDFENEIDEIQNSEHDSTTEQEAETQDSDANDCVDSGAEIHTSSYY